MKVRETTKGPAFSAQDVHIDIQKCAEVAHNIGVHAASTNYTTANWAANELHPSTKDKATVDWIFCIDTLNFSFWSELDEFHRFAIFYDGRRWTGYWALVAAIQRALAEGTPITSPEFWRSPDFTMEVMQRIFRSASADEPTAPLLDERFRVLQEAGRALGVRTSFVEVVEECNHSVRTLIEWVVEHIPSYRDIVGGIAFLKRAQILVGDLWACFEGSGWGRFDDISELTMFADYRVPQILADLGCLVYSSRLRALLDAKHVFKYGDSEEIELRACSIWAVETILESLPRARFNAVLLDFYLWDAAKRRESLHQASTPCHRVRSIYY